MKRWLFSLLLLSVPTLSEAALCTLSWNANAESDLAGYHVYHSMSSNGYVMGGFNFNTTQTSLTCEQMGVGMDGKLHYWTATAYDNVGNESSFATQVWMQMPIITQPPVVPPPPTPPPAPTCLRFAGKSTTCKQWSQ